MPQWHFTKLSPVLPSSKQNKSGYLQWSGRAVKTMQCLRACGNITSVSESLALFYHEAICKKQPCLRVICISATFMLQISLTTHCQICQHLIPTHLELNKFTCLCSRRWLYGRVCFSLVETEVPTLHNKPNKPFKIVAHRCTLSFSTLTACFGTEVKENNCSEAPAGCRLPGGQSPPPRLHKHFTSTLQTSQRFSWNTTSSPTGGICGTLKETDRFYQHTCRLIQFYVLDFSLWSKGTLAVKFPTYGKLRYVINPEEEMSKKNRCHHGRHAHKWQIGITQGPKCWLFQ